MNAIVDAVTYPLRWVFDCLRDSLPGRYLRALSASARTSLGLAFGLAVAITVLQAFSDPEIEVDDANEALPVVAREVQPRSLSPELHVFGRVENPNTTALRAATLAYVTEVKVREGQSVSAGDVLLTLDDRDARLSVRRAEAALAEARGEFERVLAQQSAEKKNAEHQRDLFQLTVKKQERFRTLFSKGQVSATDYDALEEQRLQMEIALNKQEMLLASHPAQRASTDARVKRAEADWQESVLNLERLTFVAPFDGTIIDINAAIGARIDAGQTVMTLFDADSQQVRVSLPERDAREVLAAQAAGERVTARARAAGAWVDLDLLEVGSRVRSGRAGTDVLFAAPGNGGLALGRAVDVKIKLPPQRGLIEVPLQGVYADRIVYTIENDALRAVDVERVGVREDAAGNMSLLLRSDSLEEGDAIVVSSLSRASTGTKVRVIGSESSITDEVLKGNPAFGPADAIARNDG